MSVIAGSYRTCVIDDARSTRTPSTSAGQRACRVTNPEY
jgi:hypothetical protein